MASGSIFTNISASGNSRQHNGHVYNTPNNSNTYNVQGSQLPSNPFMAFMSSPGKSTPLHKACVKGNIDVVRSILQESQDDLNAKDDEWMTPLQRAVSENHLDVARVLLEHGADTEAKEVMWNGAHPALFMALRTSNHDMIHLLLDHGADIEAKAAVIKNGTPLILAARDGRTPLIPLLLSRGANIEARDADGKTPLWWATREGRVPAIKVLLEHGASKDATNYGGQSVMSQAKSPLRNHLPVAEIFGITLSPLRQQALARVAARRQ